MNRNSLPTKSDKKEPKMEYDIMSGGFYWDDEGFMNSPGLVSVWGFVINYRTRLTVGPAYDVPIMETEKFDRQIYKMAKRYFPDWIGFQESRCSYNAELAGRMIRIIKVGNWRLEKTLKEDDERFNETA
jgi:hypothetical protein